MSSRVRRIESPGTPPVPADSSQPTREVGRTGRAATNRGSSRGRSEQRDRVQHGAEHTAARRFALLAAGSDTCAGRGDRGLRLRTHTAHGDAATSGIASGRACSGRRCGRRAPRARGAGDRRAGSACAHRPRVRVALGRRHRATRRRRGVRTAGRRSLGTRRCVRARDRGGGRGCGRGCGRSTIARPGRSTGTAAGRRAVRSAVRGRARDARSDGAAGCGPAVRAAPTRAVPTRTAPALGTGRGTLRIPLRTSGSRGTSTPARRRRGALAAACTLRTRAAGTRRRTASTTGGTGTLSTRRSRGTRCPRARGSGAGRSSSCRASRSRRVGRGDSVRVTTRLRDARPEPDRTHGDGSCRGGCHACDCDGSPCLPAMPPLIPGQMHSPLLHSRTIDQTGEGRSRPRPIAAAPERSTR